MGCRVNGPRETDDADLPGRMEQELDSLTPRAR
jgi:hypothetical protein